MSEHTLDDLAALERELTALGAIVLSAKRGQWIEFYVDGTFTAYADRTISGEGPKLGGKLMSVSRAIRQWQASAEPAPPPAAPVVTITDEMVERGAQVIWKHHRVFSDWPLDSFPPRWDEQAEELQAVCRQRARNVLEAALRGADLAPEGARDGQ